MKKIILLILATLAIVSCEYRTEVESEEAKRLNGFNIVVIDSCEYLIKKEGLSKKGYGFFAHKGNCRFCKERKEREGNKIMTQEKKKQIADVVKRRICSCYFGCKYEHILKALDKIDKIGAYKDFFEPILDYREEITIDSDKLFSQNIDDSINYLLELKKDGWTRIDEQWSGYESNYFVACKYIKEPKDAYKERLENLIKGYISNILEEEKKIKEKEEMIEILKKELNKLKNKK